MIASLIQQGFFREVTSEGQKTWILQHPVQVVVKADVLKRLQQVYPLNEETGGILYAFPAANKSLVISRFTVVPNQLTGEARKTGYKPLNSANEILTALRAGALPLRFHSHPVEIYENPYDRQPLAFFQKTSPADRHNAYLPLNVEGYRLILPDGLLSADDRQGKDVRFYLYGGLIAPDSLKALFSTEKLYIYFALSAVVVALLFSSLKRAWSILLISGIASLAVFLLEKRPTGVKNEQGDLIITIY